MKIFLLICLAIGLASTDKLDRTYLPPPGSKFSGGSPGDIQVPFEYPKETYLTGQSGKPQPEGIPEIKLGINRRPINGQGSTQRPGFTKFLVPQTTTSYAITQTTTFAPPEEYGDLDQGSGFLNTTSIEPAGLPKYPQGLVYQNQPKQGRPGIPPAYNQYQPGQNQQGQIPSTLAPYGTTQRPFFGSNRKPEPYLPPVPSKEQTTSGQNVLAQNNEGYPYGQTQSPAYQDGQQSSVLFKQPGISLPPANQRNQFNNNVNIPSSTTAPQYQGQRFGPTNMPNVNQQRFGVTAPTQQYLNQFPGSQSFATSTVGPQYQDKTPGLYIQNQNIPSTVAPQYQNGENIINPESNLQNQYISSTTPPQYQDGQVISGTGQQHYQQNQNGYPISPNFPSSTATAQFQNGQQFNTPGSVLQSQYSPSTTAPHYQGSQQFVKPRIPQGDISNQGVFGSRIPSQQNQKYPSSENFPSSTSAPQFQNGQQFVTTGSDQPVQFLGNQNIPSTASPQYQGGQRVFRPETSQNIFSPNQRVIGSQVPSQQNQYQYVGNRLYPSTTAAPQFTDSVQFSTPGSTLNQYQSEGQQNFPSSTAAPQYQFTSPELDQQNQHIGNQFQNGQRFSTPQGQTEYYSRLPNQGPGIRGNQQFPTTAAPQYQSTFSPTPGSNQQGLINVDQYSAQPNYNQRFPSSTIAPQQFVTETSAQYGNQAIQTGPQRTSSTSNYNQDATQPKSGSLPTLKYEAPTVVNQGRPERPQAASDRTAEILSYENVLTPEGYSYSYDTSNGIHADETGTVGNGTRAEGGYSYTGDDGKIYSVFYSADENGFQPRGDHLPTPPPIPEAIQRVIEQANKDKESGISDDGSYNEEKYGHKKFNGITKHVRPENKNVTPINRADIPNRYENRIGTQNKKTFMDTEDKQAYRDDEIDDDVQDRVDYENLDDVEDDVKDKEVTNQRTPNKRPTIVKNLTVEDNRKNDNIKSNINRRPATDKEQVGDIVDDILISEETDLDESQNQDEQSDLINYEDDPNSRTDFHGKNKYLPKPKGDKQRPMTSRDNKKTTSKGNKIRGPTNRKPEISQNVSFEDEQDFRDDDRVRKPSRKNKISQKVDQSKFGQPGTLGDDDNHNSFSNSDREDNTFDEKMKSTEGSRPNKPERNQFGIKRISKPVKSRKGGYETISDNENVDIVKDEGKGYEYTPPQKKFQSGQTIEFPTLTSVTERPKVSQKESPTTLRPFMTPNPNVYSDDNGENTDNYMAGKAHGKPMSPSTSRKQIYPGSRKDIQKYNNKVTPGETERDGLGEDTQISGERLTTPSQVFERFQSSSRPQYEEQDAVPQNEYNKPTKSQISRRPGNKIIYNNNAPNDGTSTGNNRFVSTTPSPPSVFNQNIVHQSPDQYKPTDDKSRIINTQAEDMRRPGTYDILRNQNSQGLVPSTTYRPNYVFGDRTLAPKGSVTVDGFGQPILSTTGPEINELANQPGRVDGTFRPTEGRFGVTGPTQGTPGLPGPGVAGVYQGSTSAPGEDFSGPKQPQRYDPETGYYYK